MTIKSYQQFLLCRLFSGLSTNLEGEQFVTMLIAILLVFVSNIFVVMKNILFVHKNFFIILKIIMKYLQFKATLPLWSLTYIAPHIFLYIFFRILEFITKKSVPN